MSALVLGIETSCDETAASVVDAGREMLSNVIATQIPWHVEFGGVVPEIASRKHLEFINPVIKKALSDAGVGLEDIAAVAVTYGPGLVGGLLVGLSAAKAIAYSRNLPLIGVNHIEGHIYANFLAYHDLEAPLVCLTVSGGHTTLLYIEEMGEYTIIGQTRDDAAGEAFDKVSRVLGLGYPGGPAVEKSAKLGNPRAYDFPKALPGELDFSFSGLKTAVINTFHNAKQKNQEINLNDLAASFQESVVEVLVEKTMMAAQQKNVRNILLSGGVASNERLREALGDACAKAGKKLYYPPKILCTDNAAMIACAGYYRWKKGYASQWDLNADPRLGL